MPPTRRQAASDLASPHPPSPQPTALRTVRPWLPETLQNEGLLSIIVLKLEMATEKPRQFLPKRSFETPQKTQPTLKRGRFPSPKHGM